jgi:hypothetical protein
VLEEPIGSLWARALCTKFVHKCYEFIQSIMNSMAQSVSMEINIKIQCTHACIHLTNLLVFCEVQWHFKNICQMVIDRGTSGMQKCIHTDDPLSHQTLFKLVQGGGLIVPFVDLMDPDSSFIPTPWIELTPWFR